MNEVYDESNWRIYLAAGRRLIEEGNYAHAERVLLAGLRRVHKQIKGLEEAKREMHGTLTDLYERQGRDFDVAKVARVVNH
ncbi:MAG TPA: hypothetical protein V6D17_10055 [Candidatus Obscuribacterales bacterium]